MESSSRLKWEGEGAFPPSKPQTRQLPEARVKMCLGSKTFRETKPPPIQEKVITSCFWSTSKRRVPKDRAGESDLLTWWG